MTKVVLGIILLFVLTIDVYASKVFDGMTWYHSHDPSKLSLVPSTTQLKWIPGKPHTVYVRLPEQRMTNIGDSITLTYLWQSKGDELNCDCHDNISGGGTCDFDDDVTCLAGTGDFRLGMFDSNGKGYVNSDNFGEQNNIFSGYLGYQWRFHPHICDSERFTEYKSDGSSESHTNVSCWKRNQPYISPCGTELLGDCDPRPWTRIKDPSPACFNLGFNEWAVLTINVERVSSSGLKTTFSFNGLTYSTTDTTTSYQPAKIDVFAMHFSNARPYDYVILDVPYVPPVPPEADFDESCIVDAHDLLALSNDWLKKGTSEVRGTAPNAGSLILHYSFDGTSGQNITSVPNLVGTGFNLTKFADSGSTGTLKYGSANPMTGTGTSADFQNPSIDPGTALFTNDTGVNTAIDLNRGAFTVEAFIKMRTQRTGTCAIIRKYTANTSNLWYLDLRPTGEAAFAINSDTNAIFSGAGTILTDTWYHVAGAFDENDAAKPMKLYVDSVLVKSGTYNQRPGDSANSLGVGCIVRDNVNPPANSGQFFDGLIDEIKLYNYALSEDEVIYDAHNGTAAIYTPLESVADMVSDDIIDMKDFAEFALQWLDVCK